MTRARGTNDEISYIGILKNAFLYLLSYIFWPFLRPPFSLDFITAIDTALQSKFLSVLPLYRKQYQHSHDIY